MTKSGFYISDVKNKNLINTTSGVLGFWGFGVWALSFGVRGEGCRVEGCGLRFSGAEFRVQGSVSRVPGFWFRVWGFGVLSLPPSLPLSPSPPLFASLPLALLSLRGLGFRAYCFIVGLAELGFVGGREGVAA